MLRRMVRPGRVSPRSAVGAAIFFALGASMAAAAQKGAPANPEVRDVFIMRSRLTC